jgi:hypothetical protein
MGLATKFFNMLKEHYGEHFFAAALWLLSQRLSPHVVILEITPPFKHVSREYDNGDKLFDDKICTIASAYLAMGIDNMHFVFDNFSPPNKGYEHEERLSACRQLPYPSDALEFKSLVVETPRSEAALENAYGDRRLPPVVSDYSMVKEKLWESIMNNETFKGILCRYLTSKILMDEKNPSVLMESDIFVSRQFENLVSTFFADRENAGVSELVRTEIRNNCKLTLFNDTKLWLHGGVCDMTSDGKKGLKDGRVFKVQKDGDGKRNVSEDCDFYDPSLGRRLGEGEITCAYICSKLLERWDHSGSDKKRILVDSVDGDLIFVLLLAIKSYLERSLSSNPSTPDIVLRLSMSGKKNQSSFQSLHESNEYDPSSFSQIENDEKYKKIVERDETAYGSRDWYDSRSDRFNFTQDQNKGYPPRFERTNDEEEMEPTEDEPALSGADQFWNGGRANVARSKDPQKFNSFFRGGGGVRSEDHQFDGVLKKLRTNASGKLQMTKEEEDEEETRLKLRSVAQIRRLGGKNLGSSQNIARNRVEGKLSSGTVLDVGKLYDALTTTKDRTSSLFSKCKDPVSTMILVSSLMENDFIRGFAPGLTSGSDSAGNSWFVLPFMRGDEFNSMVWVTATEREDKSIFSSLFFGGRTPSFDLALPKPAHLTVKAHIDEAKFLQYVEYCYIYKYAKTPKVIASADRKYEIKSQEAQRFWVKMDVNPSNSAQMKSKLDAIRKECYVEAIREYTEALKGKKSKAMMTKEQTLAYASRIVWLLEYWTMGPLDDAKIPHPCAVHENGKSIYGWKMEASSAASPEKKGEQAVSVSEIVKSRCVYTDDVCERKIINSDFEKYARLRMVDVNGISLKMRYKNAKKNDNVNEFFDEEGTEERTTPVISSNAEQPSFEKFAGQKEKEIKDKERLKRLESLLDSREKDQQKGRVASILSQLRMIPKSPSTVVNPVKQSIPTAKKECDDPKKPIDAVNVNKRPFDAISKSTIASEADDDDNDKRKLPAQKKIKTTAIEIRDEEAKEPEEKKEEEGGETTNFDFFTSDLNSPKKETAPPKSKQNPTTTATTTTRKRPSTRGTGRKQQRSQRGTNEKL